MAIPSFQGFQKRAREAEGKTNLGALYTGQKAYIYETNGASDDLPSVGFAGPEGDSRFSIGFTGSKCDPTAGVCSDGTSATKAACDLAGETWTPNACNYYEATLGTTPNKPGTNCKVGGVAFLAGAIGHGSEIANSWQISENKKLARIDANASDCDTNLR